MAGFPACTCGHDVQRVLPAPAQCPPPLGGQTLAPRPQKKKPRPASAPPVTGSAVSQKKSVHTSPGDVSLSPWSAAIASMILCRSAEPPASLLGGRYPFGGGGGPSPTSEGGASHGWKIMPCASQHPRMRVQSRSRHRHRLPSSRRRFPADRGDSRRVGFRLSHAGRGRMRVAAPLNVTLTGRLPPSCYLVVQIGR